MESFQYELLECHTDDDRKPIQEWLASLDLRNRGRVRAHIDRMEDGNFGDVRPVGGGVSELRMDFGPGYRVYFGTKGKVIHLMLAGSKATQDSDIAAAIKFWRKHE